MSANSAYDPSPVGILPGRDAKIPGQRTGDKPAVYEATLQHCGLLRRKIDMLTGRLDEAMTQLYVSVQRELQDGTIDIDDLAEFYAQAKCLGPGFTRLWNQHISVSTGQVTAHIRWRETATPNAGGGTHWDGPFPYEMRTPRPMAGTSVVYVLYDKANEPVYVGSTKNFAARLRTHAREGKDFTWWLAYPCDSREAAYLIEEGLLGARKLRLNKKVGR